jgi:ferredoxin-NADP reductase
VQLIAGGSGVVPLVAMARAHAGAGDAAAFRLLYSVRTPDDVFFRRELDEAVGSGALRLDLVHTRTAPPSASEPPGRLTRDRLAAAVFAPGASPRVFVCGPTGFVEQVAVWLQELGHAAGDIRTERFGGS